MSVGCLLQIILLFLSHVFAILVSDVSDKCLLLVNWPGLSLLMGSLETHVSTFD